MADFNIPLMWVDNYMKELSPAQISSKMTKASSMAPETMVYAVEKVSKA
jgi:hypothetical protein